MDINNLIKDITPLYNSYKKESNIISWTQALIIMWEVWDLLKNYIDKNDIAPHKLYRIIYWKSDWSENISQKSWITREFQWRCYRIRNMFSWEKEITKKFYNLKKFTTFRESMPFFDNKKYKLEWIDMENLLELLNSNLEYKSIIKKIHDLQAKKIGIKNPRTQKLEELNFEKESFINIYNYIYNLNKMSDKEVIKILNNDKIWVDYIINIAKNTNALSQDWLKFINSIENKDTTNDIWLNYEKSVVSLISNSNALKRRRFRKILWVERIVKLVDMLYLTSKKLSILNIDNG